jgi:hypothetical protein
MISTKEEKIVYVVMKGYYSDRHIVGICSTEDKADELALLASDSWEDAQVDEYVLDPLVPGRPEGTLPFYVIMRYSGDTDSVRREGIDLESPSLSPANYYGRDNLIIFHCWATDEEHAVKIANERRTSLIAEGIWTHKQVDLYRLAIWRGETNPELLQQLKDAQNYYFPAEEEDA